MLTTSLPDFQKAVSTGSFSRTAVSCNKQHSPLLKPRTNVIPTKHSFTKLKSSTGFSGLAFLRLLIALRMANRQNTDGKIQCFSKPSDSKNLLSWSWIVEGFYWSAFGNTIYIYTYKPFLVHNLQHTHPSSFHLLLQLSTPGLVLQYLNRYRE